MRDIQNICLIDPLQMLLVEAFKAEGCNVLVLRTGDATFFDLPAVLAENGFIPDLVLQTETLGRRSVVTGLDQVDCPTIFWAVDPHLNAHWQAYYARLFDVVCSTQKAWVPKLRERGAEDVRWLPWCGWAEGAQEKRRYDMAFVGRISGQRPARKWMVDFLKTKEATFAVEDNLSYRAMLDLYKDSKIIPNESIFGEVNFRLFEAASCGCMVLGQDLGEEQESLFEPGREMDIYSHVVEFDEKLNFYLGNDRLLKAMGCAARERILADHLPANRARSLMEIGQDAAKRRAGGAEAELWKGLTAVTMWEASALPLQTNEVLNTLSSLEQTPLVLAALLRVLTIMQADKLLGVNIRAILGNNLHADSLELNQAGSAASLKLGLFDAAKAYWLRYAKATGMRLTGTPTSPAELLTLWAKEMARHGQVLRAGFGFDAARHLPVTATECLMTILHEEPSHLPTLRLLDTMLKPVSGMELARVGFLSVLTLREREDWRLALEIGLANLKTFRLESGLEELTLALEIARNQGQECMFLRAIGVRDASGLIRKRLGV